MSNQNDALLKAVESAENKLRTLEKEQSDLEAKIEDRRRQARQLEETIASLRALEANLAEG
jgi:phage shock protein A